MAKKKIQVRSHKRRRGKLPPRDSKGRFRKRAPRKNERSKTTTNQGIAQQLSLLRR